MEIDEPTLIFIFITNPLSVRLMSSPQNAQALQVENEQLKAKYKKALQELMHVLQINKTLK
jgi:membrane protein insertase Oxa1/YidC/SpoIIIJ